MGNTCSAKNDEESVSVMVAKEKMLECVFSVTRRETAFLAKGETLDKKVVDGSICRAWYGLPGYEWKHVTGKGKTVPVLLKKLLKDGRNITADDSIFGPMDDGDRRLLIEADFEYLETIRFTQQPLGLEVAKGKSPLITSEPAPGSLAKAVGVQKDMSLQKVNGTDVTEMSYREVLDLIREFKENLPFAKGEPKPV